MGSRTLTRAGPELARLIRVDHAGELGADRIYAGQAAVLRHTPSGPAVARMWDQEKVHRARFEELLVRHRVRPTVMTPVWNAAGFALGLGAALLGERAAMACTVAVETVIVDHYNDQLRSLLGRSDVDPVVLETVAKFRDEEQEHHDAGLEAGAEGAPFYRALTESIKAVCRGAIAVSQAI